MAMDAFQRLFPERITEDWPQKLIRDEIYHWVSSVSLYIKERGGTIQTALGDESPFDQINKIGTYAGIRDWCLRLHTVVLAMLESLKSMHRHEIRKAMEYTKNHYMKPIRLRNLCLWAMIQVWFRRIKVQKNEL